MGHKPLTIHYRILLQQKYYARKSCRHLRCRRNPISHTRPLFWRRNHSLVHHLRM
uniref:Uncharacterized protein n=1 Tax=Arundo donax TaxID=35708 RepID=A0A0A9BMW3_ARUDO